MLKYVKSVEKMNRLKNQILLGFLGILFTTLLLVYNVKTFKRSSISKSNNSLEMALNDENNWKFELNDKQKTTLPVRLGVGLILQIKSPNLCCSGKYIFNTSASEIIEDHKEDDQIGIFLPPIGGLKEVQLNGNKLVFPPHNYSDMGIVIPIDKKLLQIKKFSINLTITSPSIRTAGFWLKRPIEVNSLSKLTLKRDLVFIHQRVLPIVFSVIMFFIASLIFWLTINVPYETCLIRECVTMLLSWSLSCVSSSGLLRQISPALDFLHLPLRSLTSMAIFRFLSILSNSAKKNIQIGTLFGIFLFGSQFYTGIVFGSGSASQIYFFLPSSLFVLLGILSLKNCNRTMPQQILFYLSFISSLIFYYDCVTLFSEALGKNNNHIYFDRYNTTAFLLVLVLYTIYDFAEKRTLFLKKSIMGEVALQLAHDVKSPLAALSAMEEDISTLPEEKRVIIRSAVNRIRDIANNLLEKNRMISKNAAADKMRSHAEALAESISVHLISSLVDQLITEKRIEFRSKIGIEIETRLAASSYGHFALVQAGDFKRVISNLINNSVQALGDTGRVTVCLTGSDTNIQIAIQDNGKGISEDILPKLMQRGETHGKDGGSGLGLYHAKTTVESWQGSLSLASTVGVGTTVTITLPKAATPNWFVPSIKLAKDCAVIVLDDDSSIHQIWQSRIDAVAVDTSIQIIHCSTSQELEEFVTRLAGSYQKVLYLCDYELLGDKKNGLDLIEELHLQENAILVTSRYEEANIRERLGVRLIPKGMAGFVPISIQAPKKKADAILLDDDKLIHQTWASVARKNQRSLVSFYRPEDFLSELPEFDTDTPIYIDSNLGNGVYGQTLVPQVRSFGFKTVYLATGYEPNQFTATEGLTAVVGKGPASELSSTR